MLIIVIESEKSDVALHACESAISETTAPEAADYGTTEAWTGSRRKREGVFRYQSYELSVSGMRTSKVRAYRLAVGAAKGSSNRR
jgi:hypothetical protein